MSRFFIDRPIFAWVIALGILLGGIIALRALPIEQYPEVAPPSLQISVSYPGADAETLEQNVTQVIEQEMNGVEGFLYMSSTSQSSGRATITVTFEAGTDIDIAQTSVQNRLSTIEARLPEDVRRQGISVRQSNSNFLMVVALTSKSDSMSGVELGDLASRQVVDELRRVPGVGDIFLFGTEYAMRIWLDPQRLASYGLSPNAVLQAVREQNSQTAGGALGALPNADGQQINATIVTQSRFSTVREFEQIILRAGTDGATVRLKDVASVELEAQDYSFSTAMNGRPAVGMAVQLATGANALDTARSVTARMEELGANMPTDVEWSVPYDTTPFVEISVEEVVKTLIEAMALVFLIMFLFLQSWRATVIPSLVVPIALAGACLGLALFGFSINVLSLFAMVLAIGILVDDAIVVIENVERIMREEGLPPLEATRKAMDQISGAIIGITLVLVAVFVPMAFFPGSTGGIYRQFSVTLAISIFFSALMALTLTPALCAAFLKPVNEHESSEGGPPPPGWRGWLYRAEALKRRGFGAFNRWFDSMTERYTRTNARILTRPLRALAVFAAICAIAAVLFMRLPSAFLPTEDQGSVVTIVQAPPGASLERANEAINPVVDFWRKQPEVANVFVVRGYSFFGQGQNNALIFVGLTPWEERGGEGSAEALVGRATAAFGKIDGGIAFAFQQPPIAALGNASGFSFKIEDRTGVGRDTLIAARDQVLQAAAQSDVLTNLRPEDQPAAPQLRVDIDRVQARAQGLSIADVNAALSINFGSAYVNDFTRQGRVQRVLIQADAPYRMTPQDIMALRVPNEEGHLVPFSAFAQSEWTAAPPSLARYNGYPAMTISGEAAPGHASGAALEEMERIAAQVLPEGIDYEWAGISYEEKQSAGQIGALLGLSVIVVFLLLAALYESWTVPLAVLLIVPAGILGAVVFTMLRGLSADIYFNVGLIAIIGLAAKNAILIVEFAIEEEARGTRIIESVKAAARLRLRPIIMTSMAFILGMVPLVLASGAGAASRIAVGTGVMGGMITATAIGIFAIPVLYLVIRRKLSRHRPAVAGHVQEPNEHQREEP